MSDAFAAYINTAIDSMNVEASHYFRNRVAYVSIYVRIMKQFSIKLREKSTKIVVFGHLMSI